MATEAEQQNGSTDETSGQEQQGQQQATTSETEGNGEQQQASTDEPIRLPDDHPLVKTLTANKQTIASQKTELAEARSKAAKATQLEDELKARPTTEALETLQTRYDRLEGFLMAAGGPLSKALDSRTFSTRLFESQDKIDDIVKDWQRANPTDTSKALSSAASEPGKGKVNPNDLLRAAIGGGNSSS